MTNKHKKAFIAEVEKINDSKLRSACKKMVKDIPTYFWTEVASSSGKYHPPISLGEGGLVRHSIMVATIADDLITCEMFCRDNEVNRDIARVASLFHDCIKRGIVSDDSQVGHTVFEHPLLASDFVRTHLEEAKVDPLKVYMICDAIRTHMGKWTTSKYSTVALSKPRTDFEKMIHVADYMASRKYMGGLEEWK